MEFKVEGLGCKVYEAWNSRFRKDLLARRCETALYGSFASRSRPGCSV